MLKPQHVFLYIVASLLVGCGGGSGSNASFPAPVPTPGRTATPTPPGPSPSPPVTTIAGTAGMVGSSDGTGSAAHFNHPAGVAYDPADGNLYVTDTQNCVIRQVTPAGIVRTVAGTAGTCALLDSTGSGAQFNWPAGIAYDTRNGNFYITDTKNCAIRQMTPAFVVTTLAGTAASCQFVDGTGSAAKFDQPAGIAYDAANDTLYVTDTLNCAIRQMVGASASVTTLAGTVKTCGFADGAGSNASFNNPSGIIADTVDGNLYVSDTSNCMIRQVSTSGVVATVAGNNSGTQCPGFNDQTEGNASFANPAGITFDSIHGVFYVTDTANCDIRQVTISGVVREIAGSHNVCGSSATSVDGSLTSARFNFPAGLAFDSANANLYVTDTNGETIRQVIP